MSGRGAVLVALVLACGTAQAAERVLRVST